MKLFKKLGLGVVNLAIIAAVAWWAYTNFGEYMSNPWTRDGQVRGNVIQVAPRVSGMVVNIPVIDNQFVHKGDLLFELDKESFEIAIAQAKAFSRMFSAAYFQVLLEPRYFNLTARFLLDYR